MQRKLTEPAMSPEESSTFRLEAQGDMEVTAGNPSDPEKLRQTESWAAGIEQMSFSVLRSGS